MGWLRGSSRRRSQCGSGVAATVWRCKSMTQWVPACDYPAEGWLFNVSPGWGANRFFLPLPGLGNEVKNSADRLLELIERGGGIID